MKKPSIVLSIAVLAFLMLFHFSKAASGATSGFFGGTVTYTKAVPIETLESSGWICPVPGQSITVRPVNKSPINYLIPFGVESKSHFPIRAGQWILGLYNQDQITVTCTYPYPPATTEVNLNPITLFGTSK